ncbi:hypothetical protein FHT78_005415 [Rhizobium sp. BK196]|uniref:hypothetical protein n=1 Tax=Rhizobium sp. BK196 TaxID=2587073 RepID=UPI001613050A|nr:hypothetical protein [Rhizobium sp. BK196]MBB3313621.1 hypothetical protein [Rhizobium sp. BK196]
MNDLTRPIIGIENRTAQEVFDIMVSRINSTATPPPSSHVRGIIEAAERLANAVDDMANAANMGMCDEAIAQVREAIAAYRENGGDA